MTPILSLVSLSVGFIRLHSKPTFVHVKAIRTVKTPRFTTSLQGSTNSTSLWCQRARDVDRTVDSLCAEKKKKQNKNEANNTTDASPHFPKRSEKCQVYIITNYIKLS